MQTTMEKSPGKLDMIVKRVTVPVGLEELMEGLTKEVLLKKPKDLYLFASEYFSRLIILRERSSTRKAYPIRVVQSVTQAKTPLKPTRHLSRQISVRGKDSVVQKEEPKKVVALSKVSTPKEKKEPSNESTPRKNKRAPPSIRGQQLKPKGKTREKLSVPGRKIDEVVATNDKKAVRHLKKSEPEMMKVKTVEAVTSEVDNLTGVAAIKVKKTVLPTNGDVIIDDNRKKSESFGPEDTKMAHNDKKYMSVIGKAVSSLENDSFVVETEDEAKMKIGGTNFSKEENVFKPSENIDSLEKQKSDNLTIDPLRQERKEIEKGVTAGKREVGKTTLKFSEDTEALIDANTAAVDSILEQAHSPEMKAGNIDHEILNHDDNLKQTTTEYGDLRERRIGGTENVDKAIALKSDKVTKIEATAKIEETIEAEAGKFIKNKPIDTVGGEMDEEPSKEISTNDAIGEDDEGKINSRAEQVYSEMISTEGAGAKLEKQNKIENNADSPDEDIKASTIPKDGFPKKSTKSKDKEENESSVQDIPDSANIQKISSKVEREAPAETFLSEATNSKMRISKNVEDSTNKIKIVNESVDEDDEEANRKKESNEPIYKITKNDNYSNNQDDIPNDKEVLEPPENIKTDHPSTSSKTNEQSSNTDTEDKLVSIEMQQLGSSDDMLIVSISDRPTLDAAAPEVTENANSEPKLQFFRKSEELVQKENGKIREILDVEHLHKLIGTGATPGLIDTSTKEFLHSFLSNEQQYSSNDQETSRKIASGTIVRKVIETASLGLKGCEPITFHEEKVISGVVSDAILAIPISEATTIASEKSDGIQLSEKESLVGSDDLTGKASEATPQTQKVQFESLPTQGGGLVTPATEAANQNIEQLETLKTKETNITTKYASDVLVGASEATATSSIQLEGPYIVRKENASDVISDFVKVDAVKLATSEQHKPLINTVAVQQVDSHVQKGALELAIPASEILAVEFQKLTILPEESTNANATTNAQPQATTQRTSEATSNASKQDGILPMIDSDTSIAKDSEGTHLASDHTNFSENKHVYTVQSEGPQQKLSLASNLTKQDTSTSLNNLSSSFLQSEQRHNSQILKGSSEVEIIASELSAAETTQEGLKVSPDVSKQPEKHTSTAKNSEVSNSVAEHGKELMSSSLECQHLQSGEAQKTIFNTYDVAEPEISDTAVSAVDQYTAMESFAASESAHTRTLIHSFLLSEQQYCSQTQNGQADFITTSTIEPKKRKLLTQGEASNDDTSEIMNDVTTSKQPSCAAESDAARTKMPKGQTKELTNRLDQLTNYSTEDLNQESQSNEGRKTSSKISDDIPEKSSELGTATSKQEDPPTFKSVKDLLDYDNLYITKDDSTESSSGTKSLQLIIVDEDHSEENGAAKVKRNATIEDVEEMASFAEDSVVMQQRGLIGQETLRGFSMESSGEKMETSNSSSSGGSYGVVKSDISSQSVSESGILVEDRTGDGGAVKEISDQLILGGMVNKDANAGDAVSSSVEADVVASVTTNEKGHVKNEEMKIGSSTATGTGLVVDGRNVVGAIVGQHDDLAVRNPLNGDQVENNEGFNSRIIEIVAKSNIDTVDKSIEDVVAEDWVKDEATKETFNDNTVSPETLVADVRNYYLAVKSPVNGDQMPSNEGFERETTKTVTEANVDIVSKTRKDTVPRRPVKDEAIQETPSKNTESVESLVAESIAMQNEDLAVAGSFDYIQMGNKSVESGTNATTSEANAGPANKINEGVGAKNQVKDETIKDTSSKSTESIEMLVADNFAVRNDDLVATGPLICGQVENEKDVEFSITETVTKINVNEVDQTLEDMVAVDPTKDEPVKESSNKTEPGEKPVDPATTVRNDALTVTGALDQVKDNQTFEFGITETISEANADAIDNTHEDVAARDLLKDEAIKETSNSNSDSTERFAARAAEVQNDSLSVISPPNCDQVENKKSFEPAITETINKTNVGEVNKTLQDTVAVDPVKDETVNNNLESAEGLMVHAIENRAKEYAEEVLLNEEAHKADEEKYLKELQAFSKENTFVKDAEPKRPPKIGEIEQVASVIEVVKTTAMLTKRETSPKKPRKSRLAFKERSVSHSNVLIRERSKSSSSERGESKVRRTQSVGVLKSQELETKSRIPTSDCRRSAGRRPLVRQLEANSKELAEKLNFKRSSDGEPGEGDEREKENSGDAKLMAEAEEVVKEVDRDKGGSSTGERPIATNEDYVAKKADGAEEQNSGHDICAVKLDEVVSEMHDVKAEGVKFLEKGIDLHGNNNKGHERNSADVLTTIDVKGIAEAVVESVETLATEALGNRKTDDLVPAKEDGNVSVDGAPEECGKRANAAIKIQSAWKGFVTRKMLTAQRKEKAVMKIQAVVRRFLNQLRLDKMKKRDGHSSVDAFFKDTVTDFSNGISPAGYAKDKQGTLDNETDTVQNTINVLSDSSEETKNDPATNDDDTKEGLALKTTIIDSEIKIADNSPEKGKKGTENVSRFVLQNDLGSAKEKDGETVDPRIDNFVTATDSSAKQNERFSDAETLVNDKVKYFLASTRSIDTKDSQQGAQDDDTKADGNMRKKGNESAELDINDDLKTDDIESIVNGVNGIRTGHPDSREGGNDGFEDVERKVDINDGNLQIKDKEKMKTNDIEVDIKTNENDDIQSLDRIRSALEDAPRDAKEEAGETINAKCENLEIDGSAKHNKILSEAETLIDNKIDNIPASTKSLEINDLRHEADGIEAAVNMKKKGYAQNEAAELNVDGYLKVDNTDMGAKRDNITVGRAGEEGDAGFKDVERKVNINDENLQIKDEDTKKSNDIQGEVKIEEDDKISTVKSQCGENGGRTVGLKADAKEKKIGSDKKAADIRGEVVKSNVNEEMQSKSTDTKEGFREGENAELAKENDIVYEVTKDGKIADEENRKIDEGKVIQGTLRKKDMQESNIKEAVDLKGKETLSASIVETTKIDTDETADQPHQTDAIDIPTVETVEVSDQLNKQEQQNATAPETEETFRPGFNECLGKIINDAESSEVVTTETVEPENDQKIVSESRIDRKKTEESADIDETKTEITEGGIIVSSNLNCNNEIPSKINEQIIEAVSKNVDDIEIIVDRGEPHSEIADTTLRHIEDDSGSSKDAKPNVEVIIKEIKADSLRDEAKENNGSNNVYGETKSQLTLNWKVENDSQVKEKNDEVDQYIDCSKENTAQLANDKTNESTVEKLLDSKPDFYRSNTVAEPLLVKKIVPYLSDETIDSNNNTSKEETPLEEGIRAAVSEIVKAIDVESVLQTPPDVPTHDLPPSEDDLNSFGSTDSVVTVIMKPKQEVAPRSLPDRAFSTSALEDRVELLDQVQNSLLDQLSGKSKFDIDQLRKELHDATLYKEESPPDGEVLEYLYDFDPEDDPEYERVARTPLRELPDIAEEDDVPETAGGLTNEIVISNDSIEIGKEHQRLLHTGELHDSVLVTNGQSLWAGGESKNRLKHTSEFHDTVVVPLPSGADVKITNVSKAAAAMAREAEQDRNQSGGAAHDRRDSGNQTSDQQPPAGAEAVTSQDVGGAAQAALKDTAPAGPESARTAQSPACTIHEAMESENNNNKRNNAIATNVPERNMEAQAATKIQAGFRGYQVRKQLKAKNTALDQKRHLRKRTSRDNLKNPDLEEKSAVKIQAGVRGFLVRRRQKKQASNSSASA